jgi:hypothetical protein
MPAVLSAGGSRCRASLAGLAGERRVLGDVVGVGGVRRRRLRVQR